MHKKKNSLKLVHIIFSIFLVTIFSSCSKKDNRIVIWTSSSEFAPYIELFNSQHKTKAVLVYKDNTADALPPANDELKPDIVLGSYLRNNKTKKYFDSIDYLFDRQIISTDDFYPALRKAGEISHKQYLLPVSFNLPLVLFSLENKDFVKNDYTISLEQIKTTGTDFIKKNKKGNFTRIGFAPQSNKDFLYTTTRLFDAKFKQYKTNDFTYNKQALENAIKYITEWIKTEHGSIQTESDFVYKYLSLVDSKKVFSGRTLYTYTTSNKLFQLPSDQLAKMDFRWIKNNEQIPVEDSMTMMGISKWATNYAGTVEFIEWFYSTATQKTILEQKSHFQPNTIEFGIVGGFSAVKEVNEKILPTFYTKLLSNIPSHEAFYVSEPKSSHWEKIKDKVIIPYIQDSINIQEGQTLKSLEERYSDWKKQGLN